MLSELHFKEASKSSRMRKGRGQGSGNGKTCGRGHKGQKSRSGGKVPIGFEGGQTPLHKRLPKYGFTSRKQAIRQELTLGQLCRFAKTLQDANPVIDLVALKKAGIIASGIKTVKIIATGTIECAVTIQGISVSAGAKLCIEKAGGKVEQ